MIASRHSVQRRLVAYVSLTMLILVAFAVALTYHMSYQHEMTDAVTLERDLVRTVQAQAEVAVFAANEKIARGVIEGLRTNPNIKGVVLTSLNPKEFTQSGGHVSNVEGEDESSRTAYALMSPVDGLEKIGVLTVMRNDPLIQAQASMGALKQSAIFLGQIALTAVLIMFFSQHLIGKPLANLADTLAAIKPGSGKRVYVAPADALNEIGSLAQSANALLDATEAALAEVEARATTDVLTGLPNRRGFMTRLQDEFARIKRYEIGMASVLMCDLDHFKQINDQYGHARGDAVLQSFGTVVSSEMRKVDMAGRIGGEEFAIILTGTDASSAFHFAERLRQKSAETTVVHEGATLRFTVSIGVTRLLPSDQRAEDALARADHSLYLAKQNGRNRVEMAETAPPQQSS
ncbi:MAG: diguanylate cyclase [Rhodoferax sp.]|nr:diguanylate cyclase [Rhodoferax sp.]